MKQFLLIALILVPLFTVAQTKKATKPAAKTAALDPKTMERGAKVYENLCGTCHQPDGNGVPSLNPPLKGTDWVTGDKTRLINIVLKGLQEKITVNGEEYENVMPAQDYLSDQEVADVLTYVRNSFGNKAGGISPNEVKALRK
jgi:mono/diheme cytochrome c family protein